MNHQYRFKKLVILDSVLLTNEQWADLHEYAEIVETYNRVNPKEILDSIQRDMDDQAAPMCWTQLAAEKVSEKELKRRLDGCDAIITCWTPITDVILKSLPNLRFVGFWTNLAAHRINFPLAAQLGVYITYLPDYGTEAVAEMTFAGIQTIMRNIPAASRDTLRGKWPYELIKTGKHIPQVEGISTHLLAGNELGIIGFGKIGKRVAEIAQAFRMKVSYYSRSRNPEWEKRGVVYRPLQELIEDCDVISIHLSPYAPDRFIDSDLLKRIKKGALLVNTSSGRIVDQEALLQHLENGDFHAYLDVYEALPPRGRLKQLVTRNNLFTYRAGWFTQESVTKKGDMLLANIEQFLKGEPISPLIEENVAEVDQYDIPCACTID